METKSSKKLKRTDEMISITAYKNNVQTLTSLRIYVSIITAACLGILGVTGWKGFLYQIATQVLCATFIFFKGATNPMRYFHSWNMLLFSSVFTSTTLLTFILFWMMFYNFCHVF
jgi:magnesium-transporting ATPase (P-type)